MPYWWTTLPDDWWEQLMALGDVSLPIRPWSDLEERITDLGLSVVDGFGSLPSAVWGRAVILWCLRPVDEKPPNKDLLAIESYVESLASVLGWFDAVLLYGLGVRRRIPNADLSNRVASWSGIWSRAGLQFEAIVWDAMGAADEEGQHEARHYVDVLLEGRCGCIDRVMLEAQATQGVVCGREHRAAAWLAFERGSSLADLVARAVRGLQDLRPSGSAP